MINRLIRTLLAGMLVLCAACERAMPTAELSGATMGTRYSIKLASVPDAPLMQALQRDVERTLTEVTAQMSTYDPNSDLSRFNRSTSTDWKAVPAALATVVLRAKAISEMTDGRYDITVGPLIELWGFGASERRDSPPSATEIEMARQGVGFRHLDVRVTPPALRKAVSDLQLDLSSIAKGWAVDRLAELLDTHGLDAYLIDIGGELRARGKRGDGSAWKVAIERPLPDRREAQRTLALHDNAIATSGDYRNFFDADGQRHTHVVDPRDGQTIRHRLASVSVIVNNCTDADAWATALLALGERDAPALANRLRLRALFIVRAEHGFDEVASDALRDQLKIP